MNLSTFRCATAFFAAAVAFAAGCGPSSSQQPDTLPPAPRILSFTASAKEVRAGQAVTLTWETADAAKVELEEAYKGVPSGFEGQLSGSLEVTITEDALFVLEAANSRGVRDSRAVAVRVNEGAGNVVFIASPGIISAGESAVLAWTASGADTVSLRTSDGEVVDTGGQVETGKLTVTPARTTTWILRVDGREYEATVEVRPTIRVFEANAVGVRPGETITLNWQVAGATQLDLSRVGYGPVLTETDPAKIADGTFSETVPAGIDQALAYTYVLRARGAEPESVTVRELTVYIAGEPQIVSATFPKYVPLTGTFEVSWETANATVVEILEGGTVVYRSPTAGVAMAGSTTIPVPVDDTTYALRALDGRGGVTLSEPFLVDPVGPPSVTSFTATPQPGIANGGDPVTLTWNVPNARNLTIVALSQYEVTRVEGIAAETGSVLVYPNQDTTYELQADNGIGDSVTPVTASVTVGTPAKLIFNPATAPIGTQVTVVGTTVPNGGDVIGLPVIRHNAPGAAFVDIQQTGINIAYAGPDTSPKLVTLPEVFTTQIFGIPVSGNTLTVSINGWFKFSTTSITGPDTPSPFPTTALEPLAIAPFWADLYDTNGEIYVQIDTVEGERRLIVQWDNVEYDPITGSIVTVQAQVYESGKIVFAYDELTGVVNPTVSIGVVNADETDAVYTNIIPAPGDTFTLFGQTALPVTIRASATPFKVRQLIGASGFIEFDGTYPIIPPDQFAVSEVNLAPTVADGQWIELRNQSTNPVDLNGWTLSLAGQPHTFSTSLVLPPGGHLVLAQSAGAGDGLAVDYVYGNAVTLAPGDSIEISISGGLYGTFTIPAASVPPGVSWQVGSLPSDSNLLKAPGVTSMVCLPQPGSIYGTNGQRGTPGAPNTPCPLTAAPVSIPGNFEPIAATGTLIPHTNGDASVEQLMIGTPFIIDGVGHSALYVGSNGWISTQPMTCSGYPCDDSNLSVPSGTRDHMAPYWDDLDLGSGGVYWQRKVPGIAPNDGYTIISWEGVMRYSTPSDNLNFQVKFFDDGAIEFHFGTMTGGNGSSATTWWEHPSARAAWRVNVNSTSPGIQPNTGFRFQPL